jgi:hypothetical protein
MLILILLALSIPTPAYADPILTPIISSAVVSVLGASLASTTIIGGLTVGGLVSGAISIGIVAGASLLLSSRRKPVQDPSVPQLPTLQSVGPQSISPRYFAAGRVMVGGIRHWYETENSLHAIIGFIINSEPIDGVEAYIVDGENLTSVTYGPFNILTGYTNGIVTLIDCGPNVFWPTAGLKWAFQYTQVWNPAANAWVQTPIGYLPAMAFDFRNGLPGGNSSTLAERFIPTLYPGNDAKCCNLACLYAMMVGGNVILNRMAVYPKAWPEITTIVRGAKIFDPRQPSQSFSDPTTWQWSRNSILLLVWYMTHPDGGRIPSSKINWSSVIEEANYCDRPVAKFGGGTEPWARTDIQWHTGEAVKDVMARLQAACDANVWEGGDGKWNFWITKAVTPTITITDEDISEIVIDDLNSALDEFNHITPSYTEIRENYQMIPGAVIRNEDSISSVGVRPETISFKEVVSFNQVHRLTYRVMKRQNPDMKLSITGPKSLLKCVGEFVVRVNSAAANIDATFRFTARPRLSDRLESITLSLAKVSDDDYDDVVPPYDPVSPFITGLTPAPLPVPVQIPDAPVLNIVDIGPDKFINSTARVGGATPTETSLVYYAQFRQVDPVTSVPIGPWQFSTSDVSKWVRQFGPVLPGERYQVQSWFLMAQTPSAMSASTFITIP